MRILISALLGILPEILFFTMFLIYTKNIKKKKVKLFFSIMIVYFLCIVINEYRILYYTIFPFLIYFVLKMLYKEKAQITDLFIIFLAESYICFLSLLIYIPKNMFQYFVCLIFNRILLFIPFIFKNKFNYFYKKYYKLWNRNYEVKQPIKSITLRVLSLLFINFIILFFDIIIIYIINLISK